MKASGKILGRLLGCVLACGLLTITQETQGKSIRQMSDKDLSALISKLKKTPQLQADEVPLVGTFYSLAHPEWPAMPQNFEEDPVWAIAGVENAYLINDIGVASTAPKSTVRAMSTSTMAASASTTSALSINDITSPIANGGINSVQPDISNYAKFAAQAFSVIDTNNAAVNDIDLYNASAAFSDTNTNPTLQISQYKPGCLLLKASHFDYSAESRDFAVVVCDKVETPLFKNIDLSTPANNIQSGGWLVQGSVPSAQVTDPMFLVVSNISMAYNAFFQVIPYSGANVQLSGPNPYDVVSNIITLNATITDLSGVTNELFTLSVDGNTARYGIITNNTISPSTSVI